MSWTTSLKRLLLYPLAARYVWMPGRSYQGRVELTFSEQKIAGRLRAHVEQLAVKIGERHFAKPEAHGAAVSYICEQLRSFGYEPRFHEFPLPNFTGKNIIAEFGDPSLPLFVIGMHYDTVPGTGGADDNTSGVAAGLEIARALRGTRLPFRVQFVFFDNEEARNHGLPMEEMGSRYYAMHLKQQGETVVGMWSLESIGYYTNAPGSQTFPGALAIFYPTVGNFLMFAGNADYAKFVRQTVGIFRSIDGFPSEGAAVPVSHTDSLRSDHRWFLEQGWPALMVTCTAPFRNKAYHTAGDTIDKVDFFSLARVTRMLSEVVLKLR